MEIVVYDEIEKFRQYDHPEFMYPFERRRVALQEFQFDFELDDYQYGYN